MHHIDSPPYVFPFAPNRAPYEWLERAIDYLNQLSKRQTEINHIAKSSLFSPSDSKGPSDVFTHSPLSLLTSSWPLEKKQLEMLEQQLRALRPEALARLEEGLKRVPELMEAVSVPESSAKRKFQELHAGSDSLIIRKISLLFVLISKLEENEAHSPLDVKQVKAIIEAASQLNYGLEAAISSHVKKAKDRLFFSSQVERPPQPSSSKMNASFPLAANDPLSIRVEKSSLGEERKLALKATSAELIERLSTLEKGRHLYFCEGATETCLPLLESKKKGSAFRASTDPDENIALKIIAEITLRSKQQSIIVVPDRDNKELTLHFLRSLGFEAEDAAKSACLNEAALIVASSSAEDSDTDAVLQLIGETHPYTITVLGPPLGRASDLLKPSCSRIDIQGAIETVPDFDNLPLFDEHSHITGKSTNTRDSASQLFFSKAVERPIWHTHPSSLMGSFAIAFEEFDALCDHRLLFTEKDKIHWMSNTQAQFATGYPSKDTKLAGFMLAKRLSNAKVLPQIYQEEDKAASSILSHLRKDPQKRMLGLQLFLEAIGDKKPKETLSLFAAKEKLFPASFDENNEAAITQILKDLADSFHLRLKKEKGADEELETSAACCHELIHTLHPLQKLGAVIALLAAFKNIYEEKTANGWEEALKESCPLEWEAFEASYKKRGRQIAYDAVAVLCARLEIEMTQDASIGDKVLLLCC